MTAEEIIKTNLNKAVFLEHLTRPQQNEVYGVVCDIVLEVLEYLKKQGTGG